MVCSNWSGMVCSNWSDMVCSNWSGMVCSILKLAVFVNLHNFIALLP